MDTIFPLVYQGRDLCLDQSSYNYSSLWNYVLFFYRAWKNRRRANNNVAHPYARRDETMLWH